MKENIKNAVIQSFGLDLVMGKHYESLDPKETFKDYNFKIKSIKSKSRPNQAAFAF